MKIKNKRSSNSNASVAYGPERISVAYGNMPAPGLGRVGCTRTFSFVGGANGNLQVIRELGYPRNTFFNENGAKRVQI